MGQHYRRLVVGILIALHLAGCAAPRAATIDPTQTPFVVTATPATEPTIPPAAANPWDNKSLDELCPGGASGLVARPLLRHMIEIKGARLPSVKLSVFRVEFDPNNIDKTTMIEGIVFGDTSAVMIRLANPSEPYWKAEFQDMVEVTDSIIESAEGEWISGSLICTFDIRELPGNKPSVSGPVTP